MIAQLIEGRATEWTFENIALSVALGGLFVIIMLLRRNR